ncbi:MAG TPA: class I SAM-dependent methyltransferase [Candidatus Krumholzibacteria bacterium]
MTIKHLPSIPIEGHKASGAGAPDHPMRIATHRAAGLEPGGWTDELREDVTKYFDDLAAEWHSHITPERIAIVVDAITRGFRELGVSAHGPAIELGSGTGGYSAMLARYFGTVVAIDLSMEMLRLAPPEPAHRVQADGARLPLRDSSAGAIVLINAFLFPDEVARVLDPGGVVVWVNSSAEQTPIYLSSEELIARMPGAWDGVASRAGEGHWCVLRRAAAI